MKFVILILAMRRLVSLVIWITIVSFHMVMVIPTAYLDVSMLAIRPGEFVVIARNLKHLNRSILLIVPTLIHRLRLPPLILLLTSVLHQVQHPIQLPTMNHHIV